MVHSKRHKVQCCKRKETWIMVTKAALVLYVLSCPSVFPAAGFRTFISDVPIYTCGSFHKAEVKDNKSATAAR